MTKPLNVHGTALLLGDTGLLVRGPSGSGKSLLALALLDRWQMQGKQAFLVADDRVDIVMGAGKLVMSPPQSLAGSIELRGCGIVSRPCKSPVQLDLIVDLVPELIRMPDAEQFITEFAGVTLARAPVPQVGVIALGHQEILVAQAIALLGENPV